MDFYQERIQVFYNMAQCIGIKKNGVRCTVMLIGDPEHTRCGIHMSALNKVGPNQVRRNELKSIRNKGYNDVYLGFHGRMTIHQDQREYDSLKRQRDAQLREVDMKYHADLHTLENTINR